MKKDPKTFHVRTYGCQMNELDSDIMVGMLEKRGLKRVKEENEADLLILNTCSIRQLAEHKAMGKVGFLSKGKKKETIIGITGCMATAKQGSLFQKMPHIDFVLGPNNIGELNTVLDNVIDGQNRVLRTDHLFEDNIDYAVAKREDPLNAYVSIIRGCNKNCTYCVVPYTRGREVSRDPQDIISECTQLVAQGYKEICLLGQNVNSYGKDQPQWGYLFHDLLYKLDGIPGLERIRFTTSHPVDITKELMEAIRDLRSVCEHVHFPIQAGSDRILKKMHRMYTVAQYMEKVQMLKEMIPHVSLGTDIIVGFPTETEEDFMQTFHIMQQIEYSVGYIFAYSARPGTPAMRWKDDIPEPIKLDRVQRLLNLQEQIAIKQNQSYLGVEKEILVQSISRKDENYVQGRTRCAKSVIFPGHKDLIGTLQLIKIEGFTHQTLIGKNITHLEKTAVSA
ncbi:MAG: miaB [Chlamydiales bacterium]|jgi:tRNA-2-methylthio-N6-dimethylallyladenosine synthase|nr:miaB [Chlamydiales bacterium]